MRVENISLALWLSTLKNTPNFIFNVIKYHKYAQGDFNKNLHFAVLNNMKKLLSLNAQLKKNWIEAKGNVQFSILD